MNLKRLDKVEYKERTGYIHHISEEGFTPTAWLYGISDGMKRTASLHESIDIRLLKRLERNTDYTEWLKGYIGIDNLQSEDKKELLNVCIEKGIDISHAEISCYYKSLWFIAENRLKTVQTQNEAESLAVKRIYHDLVEFVCEYDAKNEKKQNI